MIDTIMQFIANNKFITAIPIVVFVGGLIVLAQRLMIKNAQQATVKQIEDQTSKKEKEIKDYVEETDSSDMSDDDLNKWL